MYPLDEEELKQLLEDISLLEQEEESEGQLRRVSIVQIEAAGDAGCSESKAVGWLHTNGISSALSTYAYKIIQIPVNAVSTLIVLPLANISSKLVGADTMQAALNILNRLSFCESKEPELEGCAALLRDIILSQEKTMFYTMTMASAAPSPDKDVTKKTVPNLKWKCALSLSRSQNVIHRANYNSPTYYKFTYLGDFDVDKQISENITIDNSSIGSRAGPNKSSPVRIYINS